MLPIPQDLLRRLRVPGYFVMAVLLILPILELIATSAPVHLAQAAWRFTVVGLAANVTGTSLLGLFFIYAIAASAGDRGVVVAVSSLAALASVICLVGAGVFPLDALQLKGQVNPAVAPRYNLAWMVAWAKIAVAGIGFLIMAISSFRFAGSVRRTAPAGRGGLVVGSPAPRQASVGAAERINEAR
jgi:hypothetical protein